MGISKWSPGPKRSGHSPKPPRGPARSLRPGARTKGCQTQATLPSSSKLKSPSLGPLADPAGEISAPSPSALALFPSYPRVTEGWGGVEVGRGGSRARRSQAPGGRRRPGGAVRVGEPGERQGVPREASPGAGSALGDHPGGATAGQPPGPLQKSRSRATRRETPATPDLRAVGTAGTQARAWVASGQVQA